MSGKPIDFSKYKPCRVWQRRDGSVGISFGDPAAGPHYQCDFGDFIEIAEAMASAFNAHDFAPSEADLTP